MIRPSIHLSRIARHAITGLVLVGTWTHATHASAQALGVDAAAEERFFRNIVERVQAEPASAVDPNLFPALGADAQRARSAPTLLPTPYGIAPVTPPLELPYDTRTDLSLPFGLENLESDQVRGYIAYYCTDGRRQLNQWIARSGRYQDIVSDELERQRAPAELIWVAAVESGFTPTARSHAGAVGLWQFMPNTGRFLGMRIDSVVDDRQDPVVATTYAVDYLLKLHETFGSWPLALAAYNAGLGHVSGELRRVHATDMWALDDYQAIYTNARNYAARIIAIATIMANASHFGFDAVETDEPLSWDTVRVEGEVSLTRIAERAGVEADEVRALNTQLVGGATDPNAPGEGTAVRIPAGTFEAYTRSAHRFSANGDGRYTLRFGESFEDVAARFGTRAAVLRVHNGLSSTSPTPYLEAIRIPDGLRDRGPNLLDAPAGTVILPEISFKYDDRRRIFYRVQPGDSLAEIADHFGVDRYILAAWNDLDTRATLWSGIVLQVYVPDEFDLSETVFFEEENVTSVRLGTREYSAFLEAARARAERPSRSSRRTYTVRSGDTVGAIAQRNGVSMSDIIRWNGLSSDGSIRVGQSLRVRR